LSAESGLLALRDVDIPTILINTVEDLNAAYGWITTSPDAAQFDTVIIDSLSEIAEVVLANAKRLVKDPRQAYGELIEKTMMAVRAFRDLSGKHIVMLAKQEPFKDEVANITMYGPSMPGTKLGNQLPYLFDEVFRLGIGKLPDGAEYRFLQTAPDLQYDAKDRSGALDPLEPPDLGHVIRKILASTSTPAIAN
jgi:hypothetical protein